VGQIRIQALLAVLGTLLVGWMLSLQSSDFVYGTVATAGGVYTEALVGQPRYFNPLLEDGNQVDRDVNRLLFSGLTTWDAQGRPVPDLAASWWVSDDGLIYTFNLRDDVRWHDGQRFTADDVVFTYNLLREPGYSGPADIGALWRSITVARVNDLTVTLTLPEPFAPLLDYTSIGILPEHRLQGAAAGQLATTPFNREPIGTGPFRLTRIGVSPTAEPSGPAAVNEILLERHPNYHGQPYLINQVRFRYFPDAETALQAFEGGFVDGIAEIPRDLLDAALENPNLNLFSTRLPKVTLIYLNLEKDRIPLFGGKLVRQALLAGINRQWMVDSVLDGQAFVATSPLLPGTWAFNASLVPIAYDPLHAGAVLDEAGWNVPANAQPGGEGYVRASGNDRAAFTLLAPDDPLSLALAEKAVRDWATIGVQVSVEVQAAQTVIERLIARDYEAALVEMDLSRYPDPDPYPFWHQTQIENGQNYSDFNHRDISQLLETARTTPDLETRAKLYRSFQARFADQTPALLLLYPVYTYGIGSHVQNTQMGPMVDPSDRFRGMPDWYVVTRRVIVTPGAVGQP
jgi:peptide/nickel transport system substrate-binding protein